MSGIPLHQDRFSLRWIFLLAAAIWSTVALVVLVGEVNDSRSMLTTNALSSARATFDKDIAFRRWAAKHGGVYVPATGETPPNPYLKVPERDIVTPSGRQLTLMNPAYMTRQVYEINRSNSAASQGHITSLNPIRPENAPDPWETKVLQKFAGGQTEFFEFQEIDGKPVFRFMRPLIAEKACLKCHAVQGYRVGDVRGGISVTIPVADLKEATTRSSNHHIMVIGLVWALGLGGLVLARRKIEQDARELYESEERYRQQFQQSLAVMLIIDPESGGIVDANPAACAFYGYECATLLSMKVTEIVDADQDELAGCISGVLDGSRRQFTARHRLADGTLRDMEVFSNPVVFRGTTLLHSIFVDVTDRLLAEQELRDKMDFAENLILNSTSPTFVINADHQVLIWNRAIEELTGIRAEEMVGSSDHWRAFYASQRPCLADLVLDGSAEAATGFYEVLNRSRLIPGGFHAEGEFTFNDRRCRLIFSAAPVYGRDGEMIAALETLEDVTERSSLESQLLQSQKMESVGLLAGGIAHDFNNVLTVISGYADLLQCTLEHDDKNCQIAREISASVDRAADMTRSLLAFSGKQEMQPQYDDLNQILDSIRKSLGRLIREDISLSILPAGEHLPVYVDRVQIEQVLINLVVNARDAMGAGGTIVVSTRLVEHEAPCTAVNSVMPPGKYACMCVADSGSGIDAATLERIFEPFFTTKEKGKGTGLGLAIVQGITARHHGHITVTSSPGSGTEVCVSLPLYSGEQQKRPYDSSPAANHHGTETVLLVEDDYAIMKLLQDLLDRYGYRVLAASDGLMAMELFEQHAEEIGIAIVDVIMPRMNGREVVEAIRLRKPKLPVIMVSGYTEDIIDRAALDSLGAAFLQKPIKAFDLLTAIRSSLSGGC